MPDVATGATGGGERNRRPPIQHAGEVTRKKETKSEETAEAPPVFNRLKIGGVAGFLPPDLDVVQNGDVDQARDWRDIGGVRTEDLKLSRHAISEQEHPLTAPPGWRRVWVSLKESETYEWKGLDDIFISDFCKRCFDDKTDCLHSTPKGRFNFGNLLWKCRTCEIFNFNCLHLVSYKAHPVEDISVDQIPSYRMRSLARKRLNDVGTPFEIPTSEVDHARYPPRWLLEPAGPSETEVKKKDHSSPRTRPTYSQVRATYERLTEEYYHDQFYPKSSDPYPAPPTDVYSPRYLESSENEVEDNGVEDSEGEN
ncbi:hypothetical protein GP486_005970 [Trichoglossum hirsutum]|uniref:Uncharacterized protein n=1 Tax=Trichoglossum hirsutum TaxID=265104 RepID=A0A9P8L885_9PEZI|nr:hypothetical protein GP486_005970 [Trichoglossum hirsutum]